MNIPPEVITILIAAPAGVLSVMFKKWHFVRLFYRLRPQSAVLKARIKLLMVGDDIEYLGVLKGKKNDGTATVTIMKIDDKTITVLYTDVFSKKYIRFLPDGKLVLLAFGD
jgi:hypothetical protein